MSNSRTIQGIFPDYPRESPMVDKQGNVMPIWDLGLGSLFQALQANFSNEGISVPNLSNDDMSTIQAFYTPFIGQTYDTLTKNLNDISGQTIFDNTNKVCNQFVIAVNAADPPLVTLAQWVPFAMMLMYAGNPNTHVAGVLNWFCYDVTNKVLYVCTTAGAIADAIWTAV